MKNFIFDFDGTLVDSMPVFGQAVKDIMDESDVAYGTDLIKTVTPLGYNGCAEHLISLGLEGPCDRVVALMNAKMQTAYETTIPEKPTVRETLLELKRRGHCLNVLTASPHSIFEPCLKRLGILDLFDNLWSCDDFGTTKADPEIYRMAARRLSTDVGEIVFVDDNLGACTTARSAGVAVMAVYDESSNEYESEMRAVCDGYIYSFGELL